MLFNRVTNNKKLKGLRMLVRAEGDRVSLSSVTRETIETESLSVCEGEDGDEEV